MEINDCSIGSSYNPNEIKTKYEKDDIDLEDISILYTTEKVEKDRTTFSESFNEVLLDSSEQGAKFLSGLKENKDSLCSELGLTSEQYDSLACVALALASQETGMGEEKGYESENTGIGKFIRGIAKQIDVWRGGASASSGLTQMKIYDFLNGDKLTDEQKDILTRYGIEANGVAKDNLYANPDKAAIATMVVLTSIYENYDDYKEVLSTEHQKIGESITDDPSKLAEIEARGNELLDDIYEVYKGASDSQKIEIRETFKQWLLSTNGSKIGDKGVDDEYNEEVQLNKLNELLANNSADFKLEEDSLHFIRYALTADGQEMNTAEYCAYGWNKGTGATGMQLDRMLAEKIGTILYNPEDFDYDQFTTNVSMLADKYAEQSIGSNGIETINNSFIDETT
ncbi:TPA: hypothetical protein IAA87_09655 [Candidatus Avigastranaerophilus faecigallinarum]|nr:hypothetical protein [Candidatus Avigastranaerophilus faecigallinarum]